jgi:hypothetical protein
LIDKKFINKFWLIIFLIGRIQCEFILLKYRSLTILLLITAWSALVIYSEVFWVEFVINKKKWHKNSGWVNQIRSGEFWKINAMGKMIFQYFIQYQSVLLFFFALVPFMGVFVASSLFAISKPKFGRVAIILGVFFKFCYIAGFIKLAA